MKRLLFIFITILCLATAHAVEPQRIYLNYGGILQDTVITFPSLPPTLSSSREIRLDIPDKKFSNKILKLTFNWLDKEESKWSAIISVFNSGSDELLDGCHLTLSVIKSTENEPVYEKTFKDILTDKNSEISICIDLTDTEALLLAGHNNLKQIAILHGLFNPSCPVDFEVEGKTEISSMVCEYNEDIRTLLTTGLSEEDIKKMVSDSPQPAGIWKALDRDTDSRYALAGGRYTLAVVPVPQTKEFDILYLNGAEVNSSIWKAGMRKGKLIPTPFKDHYDLIWYDSALEPIEYDATASVEQDIILSLSFPLLKSTLRFVRQQ